MGSYYNGSYAEFLDSLKAAGVVIRNESEVRERLASPSGGGRRIHDPGRQRPHAGDRVQRGRLPKGAPVVKVLAQHAFPPRRKGVHRPADAPRSTDIPPRGVRPSGHPARRPKKALFRPPMKGVLSTPTAFRRPPLLSHGAVYSSQPARRSGSVAARDAAPIRL